jgi:hypothetical protein
MTKAHLYMDYLREEGYVPRLDDDGDVVFKYEGGTYILFADEKDPAYFRLAFPNFWEIESEEEERQVLDVINELNGRLKVVKFFIPRDDLWASVEMFIDPIENFRAVFARSISLLSQAVGMFRDKMQPWYSGEEEGDEE